jgi:excisionase family DNA binding protein
MDPNQTKVIELLREVHRIAIKEIERLNVRIAELESRDRKPAQPPAKNPTTERPAPNPPTAPNQSETGLLNEHEVARYLKISVASVRRWRLFRKGPKFVKIGSAVRYRKQDVETWLNSCPGMA